MEATVHLLDVRRALDHPPVVPTQALQNTAQLPFRSAERDGERSPHEHAERIGVPAAPQNSSGQSSSTFGVPGRIPEALPGPWRAKR